MKIKKIIKYLKININLDNNQLLKDTDILLCVLFINDIDSKTKYDIDDDQILYINSYNANIIQLLNILNKLNIIIFLNTDNDLTILNFENTYVLLKKNIKDISNIKNISYKLK